MLYNQEYEKNYIPSLPKLDTHTFRDVFVDVELEIEQELETGWLASGLDARSHSAERTDLCSSTCRMSGFSNHT